jgi:hypothetical protein
MTKKERRKEQLERHYKTLEQLAIACGINKPNGKKLSNELRKVENVMHKMAEKWCNGTVEESIYDDFETFTIENVQTIFNHNLQGFFVNSDPRGYSLKIEEGQTKKLAAQGISLHRDWGGYGILSPEIEGN